MMAQFSFLFFVVIAILHVKALEIPKEKVVGGADAQVGSAPHQVYLMFKGRLTAQII